MTDPRDTPEHEGHAKRRAWKTISRRYRLWLVERGMESHHRDGRQKKRGFTRAEAIAAWEAQGKVPAAKLLRCKVRHLTDSLVFGSRTFVEHAILEHPDKFGAYTKAQEANESLCGLVPFRRAPLE